MISAEVGPLHVVFKDISIAKILLQKFIIIFDDIPNGSTAVQYSSMVVGF